MTTCERFDVVVVPFPFVDAPQAKPRPALVLSTRAFNAANGHTVLAMITRGAATRWPSVHRLADLAATGLKVESVVRWKVFTLDNRIIRRRIGSLAGAVPTAATGLSARSCWGGLDGLLRACDHGWPRRGEARRRGMGCAASARGGASRMRIGVIGAGSMGCLYGGRLAEAGCEVTLIDLWREHVETIGRAGLRLDGIGGERVIRVSAITPDGAAGPFDVAVVLVDANATAEAAREAARLLGSGGFAVTFQNGIGNVEALSGALGRERVVGGLSYHSAALQGPGHVRHTHAGPTWIGELDGRRTERLAALDDALARGGLNPVIVDDITGYIWEKWVLNCAINAVSAITGLRLGEIARTPPVDAFQDRLIDEILAVVGAKGIALPDPDIRATIKEHCWKKYNKPSMLQHVEQGKRTEIDALNGAVVREAQAVGLAAPFNEALTLLIKGLERHRRQVVREPAIDYDALETQASASSR